MVLRLPGPGSPARATAPAAVGATILPDRSEAKREAKWWGPAVLDAGAARPSAWAIREPGPFPTSRTKS